jgi:hypothetical protein
MICAFPVRLAFNRSSLKIGEFFTISRLPPGPVPVTLVAASTVTPTGAAMALVAEMAVAIIPDSNINLPVAMTNLEVPCLQALVRIAFTPLIKFIPPLLTIK